MIKIYESLNVVKWSVSGHNHSGVPYEANQLNKRVAHAICDLAL